MFWLILGILVCFFGGVGVGLYNRSGSFTSMLIVSISLVAGQFLTSIAFPSFSYEARFAVFLLVWITFLPGQVLAQRWRKTAGSDSPRTGHPGLSPLSG